MIARFFIVIISIFACSLANAKDFLVFAVPTAAPWSYLQDDGEQLTGIDIDILRTIGRESGYKFEFKPMSYSRSLTELSNENIDGIVGVSVNYAKVHGHPYVKYPYVADVIQNIYQRADEENPIVKYSNLYTHIIGFIRSFSDADELNEDSLINKEFSEDPNFLFDKLVNKDLDVVVASDWEASYYLTSRNLPIHFFVPVTFPSGKVYKSDRTIIFSKKVEKGIIKKIQRTVAVLIEDEILDKILDNYWEQMHGGIQKATEQE